jgi:enoyl-CoA hydratase
MPVIAVVHGAVLGAAIEISRSAISRRHARRGIRHAGSVARHRGRDATPAAVIGKRLAKDLMFTGRRLTAEEARQAGFVSRISEKEKLEDLLEEIGKTIVAAPPAAMRLAKRCIDQGVERDPQGALEVEMEAIDEQLASGVWMGKE